MAISKTTNSFNGTLQGNGLQPYEFLMSCLSQWRWFILSFALCCIFAVGYILITPSVYHCSASLLIKEEGKRTDFSSEMSSFADMGLFNSSSNVNNELTSIQSPDLLQEVIRRLHLDVNYQTKGTFHKETLYGSHLPIHVSFADLSDQDNCQFTAIIQKDGSIQLSDFEMNNESIDGGQINVIPGKEVTTPVGKLTITQTPYYKGTSFDGMEIFVSRSSLPIAVLVCQKRMTAALNGDETTIIDLTYDDVCIQRAEDFLNTLIAVYNENWVKDKNRIAVGTSDFIDERLQVIEGELGQVDTEISSYKSKHLIPDVAAASQMNMNTANQASVKISDLSNQLAIAKFIKTQINNNKDQLLPANSGLDSPTIEQLINNYNDKMLERNSLLAGSSAANPLVTDMDENLKLLRKAILFSLDNEVKTLETQINGLRQLEGFSTSRLSSNPKQSKFLLSVERQQKVKEALYLFLLQKREENGLSQAFTAYNTRIVTKPTGDIRPVAPAKGRILIAALLLGLIIPVIIIFVRETNNTKVRGRKDLEDLTIPFIGEIPLEVKKHKQGFLKKHSPDDMEDSVIVVQSQNRNIINEAFRVVRTNIEFMSGNDQPHQVIMTTSLNPGSGKTFVSINLAASFTVKGRKIIVLDLDMRRASLSQYVKSPNVGIADYLNGQVSDWHQIVARVKEHDNLDVIPVGTIPPNPSELLANPRLIQLINALRSEYDLVLIDTPPVEMVADTSIISQWVDMTVFVVRAELMERDMLPGVEQYYQDKKFNNMSILLNGTSASGNRYGYHRYGYHYGYGYGRYGGYSKE